MGTLIEGLDSHIDGPLGDNVSIVGELDFARDEIGAPKHWVAQTRSDISTVTLFYLDHGERDRR
jgi:hypothetical protein